MVLNSEAAVSKPSSVFGSSAKRRDGYPLVYASRIIVLSSEITIILI